MAKVKRAADRFGVIKEVFATRDLEKYQQESRETEAAMSRVRTDSLREIEDSLHLDEYRYPDRHSGYAVHERNRRPRSRSEEVQRHKQADESLRRRVESSAKASS
jgi:hypothetical protein